MRQLICMWANVKLADGRFGIIRDSGKTYVNVVVEFDEKRQQATVIRVKRTAIVMVEDCRNNSKTYGKWLQI